MTAPLLASQLPPMQSSWLPVLILLIMAVGFAVTNIIVSLWVGPKKTGPGKEATYESGMVPIGDTRRRFNVRFYVVAMIFLVFDVEIVFFYPWAVLFPHQVVAKANAATNLALPMLVSMGVFVLILLVAYVYAWGKGVFRWD
jgi:NADH-quinone oxidoreductase subunit A